VGCEDPEHPDFATLGNFCDRGESFYLDVWSGPPPAGWRIEKEAQMFKMVWEAPPPVEDAAPDAVLLEPGHFGQAVDLAKLTNPGPFGPRTPELGEYFGYFEGGQLIAMAGERMCAGNLHEVSGICTHPAFQGRGSHEAHAEARAPATNVARLLPARPGHNTAARALYEKMGFRIFAKHWCVSPSDSLKPA
jgi:ribosomal protein S18 acetylase RimI-like enzyme